MKPQHLQALCVALSILLLGGGLARGWLRSVPRERAELSATGLVGVAADSQVASGLVRATGITVQRPAAVESEGSRLLLAPGADPVSCPSHPPSVLLEVCDESGAPVEGALLVRAGSVGRTVDPRSEEVLARSDARGSIALAATGLASLEGFELLVLARGFLPGTLPGAELGTCSATPRRVTLAAGHEIVVRCETSTGEPLAGAWVGISQGAMPDDRLETLLDSVPGDPASRSIHVARSDERGLVRFSGLEAGSYATSARAASFAPSGYQGREDLQVPGPEARLRFSEIVGVACQLRGDEVVTYSIGFQQGLRAGHGLESDAVFAAQRELSARFPGALTAAVANSEAASQPEAILRVLGRHLGYVEARVPFRAWRDLESPTVVELADFVDRVRPIPLEPASLLIVDGIGGNPPLDTIYARVAVGSGPSMLIELDANSTLALPAGVHDLMLLNSWIRPEDFEPHQLAVPGDNVIRLAETYRPCRIRALHTRHIPAARFGLTMERDGGQSRQMFVTKGEDPPVLWLPVGTMTLTADADAATSGRVVVEVEVDEAYSIQEIDVFLQNP
jgi:hypothetical protein